MEAALACHYRCAVKEARMGLPEVSLGIIPVAGGSQRLPRLVGKGRALELLLTGEHIDAREAWRIGLVNQVLPPDQLLDKALALAHHLGTKAPVAIEYILNAVNSGLNMPFEKAVEYEATLFGLVASTQDMREGTQAFLEKRKPRFKGQ